MSRQFVHVIVLVATCALVPERPVAFAQQGSSAVNADAKSLAGFQERINAYVEIHKKAEGTLPKLPQEATPQQIDRNQRELGRLIVEARAGARQGDITNPDMDAFVRGLMARLFKTAQGPQLKASIMDENPQGITLKVNQRYPDEVPFSTMPPQVLEALPKMPEELEYRFVGTSLVILDGHAHLIVDFVPRVISGSKP